MVLLRAGLDPDVPSFCRNPLSTYDLPSVPDRISRRGAMILACCPVCGADRARPVVTLDAVPVLCNQLWPDVASARAAPRATLALTICEACRHLWNTAFEPDQITSDPSFENSLHHSAVFRAFADELARRLVEAHGLRGGRVVE